jgi:hypothetical protein
MFKAQQIPRQARYAQKLAQLTQVPAQCGLRIFGVCKQEIRQMATAYCGFAA